MDEKFLRQRQYTMDSMENYSPSDIPPGMNEFSPDDVKAPGADTGEQEQEQPQEQED